MGLAFITKEVSFIFGAIVGGYFLIRALVPGRGEEGVRRKRAAGDLAVIMLALVLPFVSGIGYTWMGWDFRDPHTSPAVALRGAGLVGALFAVSVAGVMLWSRRSRGCLGDAPLRPRDVAGPFAVFWVIQILFFTTFFSNVPDGLVTGIVGSLGYWLGQQEVARGSQPWFYYAILGALYEFLALIVGGAAMVHVVRRLRNRAWDPVRKQDVVDGHAEDADPRSSRRGFLVFLLWWTVGSWVTYAWAGEKMPWLLTHMVLPLALLAGVGLAALTRLDWRRVDAANGVVLAAGSAAVLTLIAALVRTAPFGGRDIAAVSQTAGWWLRAFVVMTLLTLMTRAARRAGAGTALRLAAVGAVALLALLTVRTTLQLNFVNYDLATEPMSYAQGAPDVKRVMRDIELISARTVGERELVVAFDDETSWPFAWYLRDWPNARAWGVDATLAESAPVILVGPKNRSAVWPHIVSGYVARRHLLVWWPLQGYVGWTPSTLRSALFDAASRERLWQIIFHRRYPDITPTRWPLRKEFDMYVRSDLATAIGIAATAGTDDVIAPSRGAIRVLNREPEQIVSGFFDGRPLRGPTAVARASDGSTAIADGGNHRVVVLTRDGTVRLVIGGERCAMTEVAMPGCFDPDGPGPMSPGDGQFNEPWGVAFGARSEIFVADTWNGRIQVFDHEGALVRKWGAFGAPLADDDERGGPMLYGPRGLSVDGGGNLAVADTGNGRVLFFEPGGSLLRHVGTEGSATDAFDEPVGLAHDTNGTLLVADAWNGRIKRLDEHDRTLALWRVPGWASRGPGDKPFVAVDAHGTVYASDPENGRVLIFTPAGDLLAGVPLPHDATAAPRPTGLAVDDSAGKLLVVDHAGGRVLVYPLFRRGS
jgi:uncharacterized protein (TIGR03663 family)